MTGKLAYRLDFLARRLDVDVIHPGATLLGRTTPVIPEGKF